MKKIYLAGLAALFLIVAGLTGCKDQFSEINTDPSKVEPDIRYNFTAALLQMDVFDYTVCFYNNSDYFLPWTQTLASSGGNGETMNRMGACNDQYNHMIKVKYRVESVRYGISQLEEDDALSYEYIKAKCNPMLVFMGLFGTDPTGSIPYTEAAKAYFTDPPLLTPKYETQEELFDIWLDELDETIEVLSSPVLNSRGEEISQVALGAQDFVYGNNNSRWLKFTNSLKLKIAVRMLHVDKARALKIAEEVAQSPAGIMDGLSDDFIWNPGSEYYHYGDAVNYSTGAYDVVKFMVDNKDPRIRVFFKKNGFNSTITAAFIKNGKRLPSYIDQYVDYKEDGSFGGWKAPGEPWVRYHGVPVDIQAVNDSVYNQGYYDTNNFKLKIGDVEKTYSPYSGFQEELNRGQIDFSYPSLPGVNPVEDNTDQPYYAVYMSTGEVNFYLAELKLLGANLPGTAADYFRKGIEMSVRVYDRIAELNKIPYYGIVSGLTDDDASIDLQESEITELLEQPAYQLTGSLDEQLEKVYIQEYLHFIYFANDQFVTVRRSGVPKTNSNILRRVPFDSKNPDYIIPRRLYTPALDPTDQMYDIKEAAYQQEGFTPGSVEPNVLATERVWYDKNAPAFGAGPNYQ